jgi:ABC-type nitrate/sulfonate/bicarbonate transport system permease component
MKLRKMNAVIGGTILGAIALAAVIGLFWTPFDPLTLGYARRLAAPDAVHWLGTDEFGRDVLSRLMTAAATSARISVLTVATAVLLGTLVGVLSGYLRGWTDRVLMAFNDALLAFPGILLALGFLAVAGANEYGIVIALGIAYAPSVARIVRGTVMSLREMDYIAASRLMGNSECFIVWRHVLPNCVAPLVAARGERAELPGPGRAAARADLGQHAGRQPALHRQGRLACRLSGCLHLAGPAGHQPAGRCAARPSRSPHAERLTCSTTHPHCCRSRASRWR